MSAKTIHCFGHEDISHLSPEFLTECLVHRDVMGLMKAIYFDPKRPRNHCVRPCKGQKSKMETYEVDANGNKKWVKGKTDQVLSRVLKRGAEILQNHLDKHRKAAEAKCDTISDGDCASDSTISEISPPDEGSAVEGTFMVSDSDDALTDLVRDGYRIIALHPSLDCRKDIRSQGLKSGLSGRSSKLMMLSTRSATVLLAKDDEV